MIEAEGAAPATQDHLFTPPHDEPWARCVCCGLSEAAHLRTANPYPLPATYRCPICVSLGIPACEHQR